MKKTDMWLSGWPQKLKYFKVSPGYKLLWVCCKFRTRSGSEAGCSGDADIFLGRMAKFLVRSVALNLGFLQETSNKSAVEQILQWCGSYSWKFTSTAPFHALGLGDCMSVSRLLGSGHDKCIFLAWSGKKKPKPPSPPPPPACKEGRDDSVWEWLLEKKPQSQDITLIEWKLRNDWQHSLSPGYQQYFHALPIILFASILVYFY